MTTTQDSTLMFKDQAGDYFVLPQALLERGRVPAEHNAEIERLIADSKSAGGIDEEDVQGHAIPVLAYLMASAAVGAWSGAIIGSTNDSYLYPVVAEYLEKMGYPID